MTAHLSNQQLVDRLYEIESTDLSSHLESCHECHARWSRMQQQREAYTSSEPLPVEFFQQQRREIQNRIAKPTPVLGTVWVPATLALVLGVGLVVTRPSPEPSAPAPKETTVITEVNWFEDTYSAGRQLEPSATSPIRRLFAEEPVSE